MIMVKLAWKKLVLKNHVIHRKHNGDTLPCHGKGCKAQLRAGDVCYSHSTTTHGSDYYCLNCYAELWI